MAVVTTYDSDGRGVAGDQYIRRGSVAIGSYVTGGVAVTKANFGLAVKLNDLRLDSASGYVPRWDKTNAKVMVYVSKDPGAVGGADVVLQELANAVDLSAVGFRFRAEGK